MDVFREKFLDVIKGIQILGSHWGDICRVADLLNELQNSTIPRSGPFPGFFRSLFPIYVDALSDTESRTNYYLSTVELITLCRCAITNVVIVRRFSDYRLECERHSVTDPTRGVVITSIISNNVGAVESHYERVMSVRDLRRQEKLRKETANIDAK